MASSHFMRQSLLPSQSSASISVIISAAHLIGLLLGQVCGRASETSECLGLGGIILLLLQSGSVVSH